MNARSTIGLGLVALVAVLGGIVWSLTGPSATVPVGLPAGEMPILATRPESNPKKDAAALATPKASRAESAPGALSASELLYRVRSAYASMDRYSDTGEAETFTNGMRMVTSFATCFVRNQHFVFSYASTPQFEDRETRNWLWQQGGPVYSFLSRPRLRYKEGSIVMACGGAAGVSDGTSTAILLSLVSKPDRADMARQVWSPTVETVADSESHICYRIEEGPFARQLFVDPKSLMIREIVSIHDEKVTQAALAAVRQGDLNWKVASRPSADRLSSGNASFTRFRFHANATAPTCQGECLPPKSIQTIAISSR